MWKSCVDTDPSPSHLSRIDGNESTSPLVSCFGSGFGFARAVMPSPNLDVCSFLVSTSVRHNSSFMICHSHSFAGSTVSMEGSSPTCKLPSCASSLRLRHRGFILHSPPHCSSFVGVGEGGVRRKKGSNVLFLSLFFSAAASRKVFRGVAFTFFGRPFLPLCVVLTTSHQLCCSILRRRAPRFAFPSHSCCPQL